MFKIYSNYNYISYSQSYFNQFFLLVFACLGKGHKKKPSEWESLIRYIVIPLFFHVLFQFLCDICPNFLEG